MKRTILLAAAGLLFGACAHQVDNASTQRATNDVRRVDTSTTGSATARSADGGVYDPSVIGHPADSGMALDSGNLPRSATVGNGTRLEDSVGTSSGTKKMPKHRTRLDRTGKP